MDGYLMPNLTITGRLARGLGEGAAFTGLAWARLQFVARLGIDPFPGTVNLVLDDPAERTKWARLRASAGIVIVPPDPKWCNARCWRVMIAGRIPGAVVLPDIAAYPLDKIEAIAAVAVRAALGLNDGDPIYFEVQD
jgi:CTP-dependent riboflavin kinase